MRRCSQPSDRQQRFAAFVFCCTGTADGGLSAEWLKRSLQPLSLETLRGGRGSSAHGPRAIMARVTLLLAAMLLAAGRASALAFGPTGVPRASAARGGRGAGRGIARGGRGRGGGGRGGVGRGGGRVAAAGSSGRGASRRGANREWYAKRAEGDPVARRRKGPRPKRWEREGDALYTEVNSDPSIHFADCHRQRRAPRPSRC